MRRRPLRRRPSFRDKSPNPPSKVLGVFGLAREVSEADLREVFDEFGVVLNVTVVKDQRTGVSRGFGFVDYETIEEATSARRQTSNLILKGRKVRVDFSLTQKPHPSRAFREEGRQDRDQLPPAEYRPYETHRPSRSESRYEDRHYDDPDRRGRGYDEVRSYSEGGRGYEEGRYERSEPRYESRGYDDRRPEFDERGYAGRVEMRSPQFEPEGARRERMMPSNTNNSNNTNADAGSGSSSPSDSSSASKPTPRSKSDLSNPATKLLRRLSTPTTSSLVVPSVTSSKGKTRSATFASGLYQLAAETSKEQSFSNPSGSGSEQPLASDTDTQPATRRRSLSLPKASANLSEHGSRRSSRDAFNSSDASEPPAKTSIPTSASYPHVQDAVFVPSPSVSSNRASVGSRPSFTHPRVLGDSEVSLLAKSSSATVDSQAFSHAASLNNRSLVSGETIFETLTPEMTEETGAEPLPAPEVIVSEASETPATTTTTEQPNQLPVVLETPDLTPADSPTEISPTDSIQKTPEEGSIPTDEPPNEKEEAAGTTTPRVTDTKIEPPISIVTPAEDASAPASSTRASSTIMSRPSVAQSNNESIDTHPSQQNDSKPEPKPPTVKPTQLTKGTSLRVVTAHNAADGDELELEVGDIVELDLTPATDNEYWWKGTNRSWGPNNGSKGFFPAECVVVENWETQQANADKSSNFESLSIAESTNIGGEADSVSVNNPIAESENEEEDQEDDIPAPVPPGTKVECRYSYTPLKADEMQLHCGDFIVVLEAPDGGWWRGMKNLGGKEAKTGWFPATMVKLIPPEEDIRPPASTMSLNSPVADTPLPLKAKGPVQSEASLALPTSTTLQASSSDNMGSTSSLSIGGDKKKWYNRLVKKPSMKEDKETKKGRTRSASAPGQSLSALSSPTRQLPDPTENEEDDVSRTRDSVNSRSSTSGESANHVADLPSETKSKAARPMTLFSSHKRSTSAPAFPPILSIYGGFQNDKIDEVDSRYRMSLWVNPESPLDKPWYERVLPDVMNSMNQKERNRMAAVWELMVTERDYCRDLKIIIDLFMKPMIDSKHGTGKNINDLFANVDELLTINKELLRQLEDKYAQNPIVEGIGTIFIDMYESFSSYNQYCSNHSVSLNKLQSMTQSNRSFRTFLEDIYKSPVTRNLDLGSFLIKPVQRICKYPLLLKEIMKNTDESKPDYQVLKDALDGIQRIISIINDGARATDSIRKIVEIQGQFNEKMNLVTPTRYLVREDNLSLVIRDGKKSRKLFLFNDLLVVARKDWRDKYHVVEQANLRHCRVCDVTDETEMPLFEIEILPASTSTTATSPTGQATKRYLLGTPTKQVKVAWLEAYRGVAMGTIKKKKLSESSSTELDAEEEKSEDEEDFKRKKEQEEKEKNDAELAAKKLAEEEKRKQEELLAQQEAQRKKELDEKIATYEVKLQDAVKQAEAAEAKLQALQQQMQLIEKQKEDANSKATAIEATALSSQERVKLLETYVKDISKEKEALTERANSLQSENARLVSDVNNLKLEVSKQELLKTSIISEKDLEIERIRRELTDIHEREKMDWKAERATLLSERNSEKASLTSEITKIHHESIRQKEEAELKLKQAIEDSEARMHIVKQETEVKMIKANQEFEIKLLKQQEEARSKVQSLESTIAALEHSVKTEMEQREALLKNLELERSGDKQKLLGELELVKERTQSAQENLKRSLAEVQSQLKDSQQILKDRESTLRHKEDQLREKETVLTKLEVEKNALNAEVSRLNHQIESTKSDYARSIANIEKTLLERQQVISRKESEINELTQKLAQQVERTNHAIADFEKLKSETSERGRATEENVTKLRDELSKIKTDRAREQEQYQTLERTHKEATANLEQTKSQLQSITEANRRFASEHAKVKENVAKQNQQFDKMSKENIQLQSSLTELQEKIQRKTQELSVLQISDQGQKELIEKLKDESHKTLLRAERAETRASELERSHNRFLKEFEEEIAAKNAEISELKESLRKDYDAGKGRLSQELLELKQRMSSEFAAKEAALVRESSEAKSKLEMELADIRKRRDHEEDVLQSRLKLVERLEKETNSTKERLEKENAEIREKLDILEVEYREKAKTASSFKKRARQLEAENNLITERLHDLTVSYEGLESTHNELAMSYKSLQDEAFLLRTRALASEKEVSALAHRIGMYNELDNKYLQLREETVLITKEAKSFEGELRKSETVEMKLKKEVGVYKLVLEEIERSLYNAKHVTSSAVPDSVKSTLQSTIQHMERISSQPVVDETRLVSIVCRLNDILLDHDKLIEALDAEKEKSKELEQFTSTLEQEKATISSALKKYDLKLKEKSRESQEELSRLKKQSDEQKRELDTVKSEKASLDSTLSEARSRVVTLESEKQKLEGQFVELFERLQKQAEAQMQESKTHTSIIAPLRREIEMLQTSQAELKKKDEESSSRIRELDMECTYLRQLTESLTESKRKTQDLLESSNALNTALRTDLDQNKKALLAAEQKVKDLKDQRSKDQESLAKEKERASFLQQEIINVKRLADEEIQKRGDEAEAEITRRDEKIEKLEELWRVGKKRTALLEARLGELQKEIETLADENAILEDETKKASMQHNILRSKLAMLQSNVVESNQRLSSMSPNGVSLSGRWAERRKPSLDPVTNGNETFEEEATFVPPEVSLSMAAGLDTVYRIHSLQAYILRVIEACESRLQKALRRHENLESLTSPRSTSTGFATESLKSLESAAYLSQDIAAMNEAVEDISLVRDRVCDIVQEIEAVLVQQQSSSKMQDAIQQHPHGKLPVPTTRSRSRSPLRTLPPVISQEDLEGADGPFESLQSSKGYKSKIRETSTLDHKQLFRGAREEKAALPVVRPDSNILFSADELMGILGFNSPN
ncbi:cytochrome c oxidase subunit 1 [Chytridiales sp. JEL 0842]|nr:cytochrome c oxidase subunit 1 [Chytridiales sp. JEL 0842]